MGKLTFDGRMMHHRPEIDYAAVQAHAKARSMAAQRIIHEETGNEDSMRNILNAWVENLPETYRHADLASLSYDTEAQAKMRRLADEWQSGDRFNVVFSSPTPWISGKTWAMYAWLHELISRGLIGNPFAEIAITDESELAKASYNTYDNLETVFYKHPDLRILVVDGVGNAPHTPKRISGMWKELQSRCRNHKPNKVYLVLILGRTLNDAPVDGPGMDNKNPKRRGMVMGQMSGASPVDKAFDGFNDILPLRGYRKCYPHDGKTVRGVILTNEPDITEI